MTSENNDRPLILIVDDVPKNLQVLGATLYQVGYEIAMADNGKTALEMLENTEPHLILLDIMMPELDGFQVCEHIKKNERIKDIPIIFITAKNETDSIVKGFQLGAVDYITKPFNNDELLARVATHLELISSKRKVLEYNKELEKLVEQKSEFLGIAAHDMKSPINAITGFTDFLISDIQNLDIPDSDQKNKMLHNLKTIKDTSNYMYRVVNELLNNETLDSGKIELNIKKTNITQLVFSIIRNQELKAESKRLSLYCNKLTDCYADLDEERFREIADNLLSNAIKYSKFDKGIWITVYTKKTEQTHKLVFSVKDEGPGLTDEDKEKVFGRFQKLSARPTGGETSSGLGLSIVKKLVELHGGEVSVKSKTGKGAEFIVEIAIPELYALSYPGWYDVAYDLFSNIKKLNSQKDRMPLYLRFIENPHVLSVDNNELISELVKELDNEYMSYWISISKTNIVNDIRKFAAVIKELGKEYSNEVLTVYGDALKNQALSFDIEKMPVTLSYFPEILSNLKLLIQNTASKISQN